MTFAIAEEPMTTEVLDCSTPMTRTSEPVGSAGATTVEQALESGGEVDLEGRHVRGELAAGAERPASADDAVSLSAMASTISSVSSSWPPAAMTASGCNSITSAARGPLTAAIGNEYSSEAPSAKLISIITSAGAGWRPSEITSMTFWRTTAGSLPPNQRRLRT